jgi:hypothetical protein
MDRELEMVIAMFVGMGVLWPVWLLLFWLSGQWQLADRTDVDAITMAIDLCVAMAVWIHQDIDEPRRILLYERYDDEDAFQAHRRTPHFADIIERQVIPLSTHAMSPAWRRPRRTGARAVSRTQ